MDHADGPSTVNSAATEPGDHSVADTSAEEASATRAGQSAGIWWLLLLLVLILGYLSTSRRESLGRIAGQIADIIRDFRGYDPEF